jgi:simple sugar transport system permease protein
VSTRAVPSLPSLAGLRSNASVRLAAEIAVVVAVVLVLSALLLVIGGASPGDAFRGILDGSLGNRGVLGETLIRFAPLALIAAALVPSLRAGLFNIGAPGQIAVGGLAAGLVSIELAGLPRPLLIVTAAVAATLAAVVWGLAPALLRARLGINEILTTLVFNFLAAGLLAYLLGGPLQGTSANLPQSKPLPEASSIPLLLEGTRAHIGVLVSLAAVVALVFYRGTRSGYRLRLFSVSPRLAVQAGTSEPRLIVGSMCLGAAGAGLAGWMQVAGVDHLVYATVADPIGYAGLFVALLGAMSPVGIVVAAFCFGALLQGGNSLQLAAGVSPEVTDAIVGLVLLAVAALAGHRVRTRGTG